MVKHSLRRFLDKYPYFLSKRSTSNLYKITDVNNSIFKDLYNGLFHTYQSFHLNKRLLVWKTQTEPYVYQTHFCCSYPNIKNIEIYKNEVLIHKENFTEDEEKTDYCWTYECSYIKTNMLPIKVYRCVTCDNLHDADSTNPQSIYLGDTLPSHCKECGGNTYIQTRLWECDECGEIYFANPNSNGELDITCKNDCGSGFTEVYAYRCLGHETDDNYREEDDYEISFNCGEIYIGATPPEVCNVCGTTGYDNTSTLYYNDDSLIVIDNSSNYNTNNQTITVDDDTDVDYIVSEIVVDNDYYDVEGVFKIPFPVIPNDKFLFKVETWDEYWASKGFPENDIVMGDEYDHDYSLDEIGDLNNIPRKTYKSITNVESYPLTEPPYNNCLTEDDYHYMKRMIEYNLRLWNNLNYLTVKDNDSDNYINFLESIGVEVEDYEHYKKDTRLFRETHNPVTLELWKKYSVDSRLINRETKLLKLFDLRRHNQYYEPYVTDSNGNRILKNGVYIPKDEWEVVTDLSECWSPLEWEHKDKFCDTSNFYGEYLFVTASTLRPLPYENVDFDIHLLNSLGEPVDDDFYVLIYVYYDNETVKKQVINDSSVTGFYRLLSSNISGVTKVEFHAFHVDDVDNVDGTDGFDTCTITLNPRTCNDSDIYVDASSTQSKENGSKTYPFKDLQTALDNVTPNLNVICLKSSFNITSPYTVVNKCSIIGYNNPVITNNTSNKFFKIIGGKGCSVDLDSLTLKSGQVTNKLDLATWVNRNNNVDDYSTIVIRAGLCLIYVNTDKDEYYPTDIVKITGVITDKKGKPLPNQQVSLTFDGEYKTTLTSDSNGEFSYILNTNKTKTGIYTLEVKSLSELYFNTTKLVDIKCTKKPNIIPTDEDTVTITSTGHTDMIGETIHVYVDGVEVGTVTVDSNGNITYDYTTEWGTHTITFVDSTGNVVDMFVVETIVPISTLVGTTLIKNWGISGDTKTLTYDTITITNNTVLGDLNGVVASLTFNNVYLTNTDFHVSSDRSNATDIYASECEELKDCLTSVTYDSTTKVISYTTLGEFW